MTGKLIRMRRIVRSHTRGILVVPLDHRVTVGPINGLQEYQRTFRQVVTGGADAVILHKGLLARVAPFEEAARSGLIMHMSARTCLGEQSDKVLVGAVEEAVTLGADGVSIHVILGSEREADMLQALGRTAARCDRWQIPLLAMVYTAQENDDAAPHAVRVAEELGADLVKIAMPARADVLTDAARAVTIPMLVAGGAPQECFAALLKGVRAAMAAGASGVAIGRNIFMDDDPMARTRDLMHALQWTASATAAPAIQRLYEPTHTRH